MTRIETPLPGLDGQNPLGFLAALGLLRVLDDHASATGAERPALAFLGETVPTAIVWHATEHGDLAQLILEDAKRERNNRALTFSYPSEKAAKPGAKEQVARDLKPPPETARAFHQEATEWKRREADLAAAFFSECIQDNKGKTKPTALHFTAGQQEFLRMVEELRGGIAAADVREALNGPWVGLSELPSMSWDASVARLWALRASDPSKEKRGSVAAANWLAVQGMAYFTVFPRGDALATTAVRGRWKDSVFTWPLWSVPMSSSAAASLLRLDPRSLTSAERSALGLSMVLSSCILRSDQGGYGSFTPAEIEVPDLARARSGEH